MLHTWYTIQFAFGSYTECSCGFEPLSQEEYDMHTEESRQNAPKPQPPKQRFVSILESKAQEKASNKRTPRPARKRTKSVIQSKRTF